MSEKKLTRGLTEWPAKKLADFWVQATGSKEAADMVVRAQVHQLATASIAGEPLSALAMLSMLNTIMMCELGDLPIDQVIEAARKEYDKQLRRLERWAKKDAEIRKHTPTT